MSTQTLIRTGALPVVNLLPPEIGEQRRLRRLQVGLGAGVVASVGVVALLFVAAASQASSAQSDLDATKAEGVSLQSQTAKYADVPAVIAKVDAAKLQRTQAMAQEVRWSFFLNDLSLRIPSKVWLTSITVAQTDAATAAAPGAAAAYPEPGIGVVTFEGKAYRHNDVATWLQMLAREKGWTQPYFTNSSEDDSLVNPSGDKAVGFSSQVTVTEDALSRRFEQKAGS